MSIHWARPTHSFKTLSTQTNREKREREKRESNGVAELRRRTAVWCVRVWRLRRCTDANMYNLLSIYWRWDDVTRRNNVSRIDRSGIGCQWGPSGVWRDDEHKLTQILRARVGEPRRFVVFFFFINELWRCVRSRKATWLRVFMELNHTAAIWRLPTWSQTVFRWLLRMRHPIELFCCYLIASLVRVVSGRAVEERKNGIDFFRIQNVCDTRNGFHENRKSSQWYRDRTSIRLCQRRISGTNHSPSRKWIEKNKSMRPNSIHWCCQV